MQAQTQTKNLPEELRRAVALPAHYYVGDATLAMERRAVFGRSWQLVARREQLAAPGDHVVDEIAGVPVLLVRGNDQVLRAFPNVCRHRAGPLALCNGKGARVLCCKYHGWTYTLEGQLRGASEMQDAIDFKVEDVRLPPLRVHEWQGLVFVALSEEVPAFDEVYAGIAEQIAPIDLSTMQYFERENYDINCNWKVYVDNFLEGYHLPYVHPGLSRVLDYRTYDTELATWHSLQSSPLRNSSEIYGDGERMFYYFVYPNVMLNISQGRLQTNHVLPLGPERCRVVFDYYYANAEAQAHSAADRTFSDQVQQEDVGICELVQKGLASGAYQPTRLNPKRESGVWHFQNLLRAAYASPAGQPA